MTLKLQTQNFKSLDTIPHDHGAIDFSAVQENNELEQKYFWPEQFPQLDKMYTDLHGKLKVGTHEGANALDYSKQRGSPLKSLVQASMNTHTLWAWTIDWVG